MVVQTTSTRSKETPTRYDLFGTRASTREQPLPMRSVPSMHQTVLTRGRPMKLRS